MIVWTLNSTIQHAWFAAGVWVGAGSSLSAVKSVLEKLVAQFSSEKTELFRALIQQLRNLGSQQIRNVAVSPLSMTLAWPSELKLTLYGYY